MSCPAPTQVLLLLAKAREGVAHGEPSLELALARSPWGRPAELLAAARAARKKPEAYRAAPAWVRALADAMPWVAEARRLWGSTPDTMPPLSVELAPCAHELRQHLVPARKCADIPLAWEDTGGLSRPQALCVLQLALSLARVAALSQGGTPEASTAQEAPAEGASSQISKLRNSGPGRARRPAEPGFTVDPEEDSP